MPSIIPARYSRWTPLLLVAIGVALAGFGIVDDDRGYLVLGVVCIAGAALSFLSSLALQQAGAADEPSADADR